MHSLRKSEEFRGAAAESLDTGKWNAAGLAAIHSGISAADAALIAAAGLKSISKDHGAVIDLLDSEVQQFSVAQRRQLGGLLKMKNQVAYDSRLLTEIEARQLVDHAARLVRWAKRIVDESIAGM